MNETKTFDDLFNAAQKMADEKLEQEKAQAAERIKNELASLQKAIEMVRSGLCFVKQDCFGVTKYVFATESMLVNDYLNEPKNAYYNKGLRFHDGNNDNRVFTVNGITYYDMRYLLDEYSKDVLKEKKRITRYNEQLDDIIRNFDKLVDESKAIKRMMEDWTAKHEKEDAADE